MEQGSRTSMRYTRRQLLKRIPLLAGAGLVAGFVLGKPFLPKMGARIGKSQFPKGSIFTPAKNNRGDRI